MRVHCHFKLITWLIDNILTLEDSCAPGGAIEYPHKRFETLRVEL